MTISSSKETNIFSSCHKDKAWVHSWKAFLYLLDNEVKRAKRYDYFFSILKMTLSPLPNNGDDKVLRACFRALILFAGKELREGDILGFMGDYQLGVILPYTDASKATHAQSRLRERLDFKKEGFELTIDQISFPTDGSNTPDLTRLLTKGPANC